MTADVHFSDSEFVQLVFGIKNGVLGKVISGYGPEWKSIAVHSPGNGPVAVKLDFNKFANFPKVVKAVETAEHMDSLQFSIFQLFLYDKDDDEHRDGLVSTYIQLLLGIQEFQSLLAAFKRKPSDKRSEPLAKWNQRVAPLVINAASIIRGDRPGAETTISWGEKAQKQIQEAIRLVK